MITWNTEDYNVPTIVGKSGIEDIETRNQYYIYGLSKNKEYHMDLKYKSRLWPLAYLNTPLYFRSFCEANNLDFRIFKDELYKAKNEALIKIGLRHDLRQYIDFSSNLLKTMIYLFEGKIKLEDFNYRKVIKNNPFLG